MLHQEPAGWMDSRARTRGAEHSQIEALAYRSRPVGHFSLADLDELLRSAQHRNRSEGLTGLLIYDRGFIFQWLEGPMPGLQRVWNSIRRDPRHVDIKVLRQETVPKRFFGGWDMRLASRARGEIDRTLTVMRAPHELLTKLRLQPNSLADRGWDKVFSDAILPRLRSVWEARHTVIPAGWHAHRGAADEFAGALQSADGEAAPRYVDALLDQGVGLSTLFREVFEPAARCLGGLWEEDHCDAFHFTLAMGRLQLAARRLTANMAGDAHRNHHGHAVLVVPQPGENHGLTATMDSALFARDGWEVSHRVAMDNNGLDDLLHAQWFDVLDLSLSTAVRRDHDLPAMRLTIDAARAASLNPALSVIVGGRSFVERPDAYRDVGADVACVTCADSPTAARQLLRTLTPTLLLGADASPLALATAS